ncbi:LLM class flavin-dependent oxidoreductase [Roseovarius sp. A21]|uniref:LLM class flavin-dependent oxidoreductase n=1 Tax=Roseovarius bejariae TaxID=2576383 RepID=A0A844CYC1_9RHOB|nr:MupA/Atu3671 family FMN-dependent luciferase-like monooxygenase [Roseovarius bejariae]MRU16096.1 LLM class flavin-dependent oxidoreductase [Roseovarius bejariae]
MTSFSTLLIGDESLLVGCGEHLLEKGHGIAAVVTRDAGVRTWAEGKGIAVIEAMGDVAQEVAPGSVDWLLSIANLRVIPQAVLDLPAKGAVNFHDGPLPRYAGLNTPVWAILNGESGHGITWHMIEGGIDEGDILEQRMVPIAEDETAFSLNSKCYAAAMDSFPTLVAQLESGELQRQAQDLSQRSYYGLDHCAPAAAHLDFSKPAAEVARMVRALDFGGYRNPVATAKVTLDAQLVSVGQAEAESTVSTAAPGTVLEVMSDRLRVATDGGVVVLSALRSTKGQPIDPARLVNAGDVLVMPDVAAFEAAAKRAAKAEAAWINALSAMQPADLPLAHASEDGPTWQSVDMPAVSELDEAGIAAVALAWCRMSCGNRAATLAYTDAGLDEAAQAAPGLLAHWVPLGVNEAATGTLGAVRDALGKQITRAAEKGGFAADLALRLPELDGLSVPQMALHRGQDAPVAESVVTLAVAGDQMRLHYDAARLSPEAVDLLAVRLKVALEACAKAGDAVALVDLAPLPDGEARQVTEGWNDTLADLDGPLTIHAGFEAQAEKTPGAVALVFEDQELSYAALNGRANAMAQVLRDQGVAPGSHVGLCVHRGPELLIGALAILKAGGAYVPLDPAYPADRLAHYVTDSQASVVLTQEGLRGTLPDTGAKVVTFEAHPEVAEGLAENVDGGAGADDLAYVIYTSGSTGTPKGVMVEHGNVANFFTGMDTAVDHENGGVWMAVTSLAFDISVLELFYTLARGFKLVLVSDEGRAAVSNGAISGSGRRADFSLYYWSNDCEAGRGKYELLLEGAKFADANGFDALWTPERHFHAFGGPYPNPAVTGAAVAAITQNIQVRAGSCVAPLHHPARIAEEWSVIDNLTNGGAGLAMAAGWHPNDFVLRPENTPPANKQGMFDAIDQVRRLWRGEAVEFPNDKGEMLPVQTQPRPVSEDIPIWVTTAGNPETWREAGRIGAHVLTHLLGQSIDEVGEKITLYHDALRESGFDPEDFTVTVMLHTLIGEDREAVREIAKGPLQDYLRSAAGLIKQYAWAFPAFKKPKGVDNPFQLDLSALDEDAMEAILEFAFDRYFNDSGLFGTVEDGIARVEQLKQLGVDEVACLIDYGIDNAHVLEGLTHLAKVCERSNAAAELAEDDFSIAAQIIRHDVTHMQCTPSMARMLCMNDEARLALGRVKHLYLGGEALPGSLVDDLRRCTRAQITNMYGPTETTIWSAVQAVDASVSGTGAVAIGRPIGNTSVYVLNEAGQPCPVGVPGELLIGGKGVARGYWQRDELTEDRFVPDHVTGHGRMYRTGDLVAWSAEGRLIFLGRSDHQVKIRGQRIELGEIEARLAGHSSVREAVVIAREGAGDVPELVGYVIADTDVTEETLRGHLSEALPEVMVPRHVVTLDHFPLTPNKKIDRNALPAPEAKAEPEAVVEAPAKGGSAETIARIWGRVLGVQGVQGSDSFFELGGHSLLAVQAHREIRGELEVAKLAITDIFRFPVLNALAAHVDGLLGTTPEPAAEPAAEDAPDVSETMSRRRAMRANRGRRAG